MNRKMLKYIIREYGLSWSICRLLYIKNKSNEVNTRI